MKTKSNFFLQCKKFLQLTLAKTETAHTAVIASLLMLFFSLAIPGLYCADTPDPTYVTIVGDLQSELGCPGDWQPECSNTHLLFDEQDQAWQATFTVPAGTWNYKAALNHSWDENYGQNATAFGANIPLSLAKEKTVKFYYDHESHWVTDNHNSTIVTLVGSFQTYLGCPDNWSPDCLRTWLKDPDGDGNYTLLTTALPAGNYECKITINESWDENYGDGGQKSGPNIPFQVLNDNDEIFFSYNHQSHILTISNGAPKGDLTLSKAHWISRDTIAWQIDFKQTDLVTLHYSYEAGLVLDTNGLSHGQQINLVHNPDGLSAEQKEKFPHLAHYKVFKIPPAHLEIVDQILDGQSAVAWQNSAEELQDATSIQIPGVLDDLYTYQGELGLIFNQKTPTLKLWAPTAQSVRLFLYDNVDQDSQAQIYPMVESEQGVWSITGQPGWQRKFYRYEVTVFVPGTLKIEKNIVTDPYSAGLTLNSRKSVIINLDDPDLKPKKWDHYQKPDFENPEDIILYELHIRDFSIIDQNVPEPYRGTYKAFTYKNATGVKHLRQLSKAGFTHVHLLPVFDIATINEKKADQLEVDLDLSQLPPDSEEQQAMITQIKSEDGFNWGYDPFHYNVPEGSYASDPNVNTRVIEFREMVKALNKMGLRVVMDVVYNHTNSDGQNEKSVLDRVVPGYYHRLSASGKVTNSTCCSNTATEHAMMEKLMLDSLVHWVKVYKVDGFRFDLMGHHMKTNMIKARDLLRSLTMKKDGVDGSKIYLYGEGWNFGEVADNARGVNATQINLKGSLIGTFNDRLRDAVRGGTPTDENTIQFQGFVNGLYYDPNGEEQGDQLKKLLHSADQIRVGLAGNLAEYELIDHNGQPVKGEDINYGGAPTGYTADPQENIVYIEAHDNRTLFDIIQLKVPQSTSKADRLRIQNLGNSIVALTQGIPFFHAGQEILRSKSMDRDSYDSGDWFNQLDYTYQTNNWGIGLPIAEKNQDYWPIMKPLLANPDLKPDQQEIISANKYLKTFLKIRKHSSLFRLQNKDQIQKHLRFLNTGKQQIPGLIVMDLSDEQGKVDCFYQRIITFFNANKDPIQFQLPQKSDLKFKLHPKLKQLKDPVYKTVQYNANQATFTIPGRTTAVFIAIHPVEKQLHWLTQTIDQLVTDDQLSWIVGKVLNLNLNVVLKLYQMDKKLAAKNLLKNFCSRITIYRQLKLLDQNSEQKLKQAALKIISCLK